MTLQRHRPSLGRVGRSDPDLVQAPPAARHRGGYPSWPGRLADRAAAAAGELLALIMPVECVCCGAEDRVLCPACAHRLRLLTRRPFRAESRAPALMDMDGSVLLPVVAAGVYRGELAQAVLSFKRHGQRRLADELARCLRDALAAAGPPRGTLLVPVPTSGAAFRRRGFSPVHLVLARARRGRLPAGSAVADVLRKTRAGPGTGGAVSQKGLNRAARARRVRGSMRLRDGLRRPDLSGRACIIVDDVLTTGATLAEAARVLGAAGADVRGAVVLAATRPQVSRDFAPDTPAAVRNARETEKNKPKKDE